MWLGQLPHPSEHDTRGVKEWLYLGYDRRPIKVVEISKCFRASLGFVIGSSWGRGGLDLSSGTSRFSTRVLQHIIIRSRLQRQIGLSFRYQALHTMGLHDNEPAE